MYDFVLDRLPTVCVHLHGFHVICETTPLLAEQQATPHCNYKHPCDSLLKYLTVLDCARLLQKDWCPVEMALLGVADQ